MPLDTEHLDEICNDIRMQYESGVCSLALFSMTLVPEGNPPVNKAENFCKKYKLFRDKLNSMGLECGVLVQASVGHGWILGELFPYQSHVNFNDGNATRCACPMDEGFKKYIYGVMKTIAECNPTHIMVDDDFRTIWYKGEGCACPLHMDFFNKRAGTSIERNELWEIVNQKGELSKKYTDIYIETQKESLVETAKIMRKGIDDVNPSIHASYCCCGNNAEFAYEIASALAGEGHPIEIRINNGNYTPISSKFFSRAFHRCATQIAKLKGKADILLAETDTCPQNRYSTSASSLHSHYTGSILEGANGAKHWITRLGTYEPESGVAYRRMLASHSGFYEKLAGLVPNLKWRGCRIYTPSTPDFTYGRVKEEWDGWSYCVLERLGLPMFFSSENGGVVCFEGDVDTRLSDEEILELLKGNMILASDTAKNLVSRGFKDYIGVDVCEWSGKQPITEVLPNGRKTKIQMKIKELIPISSEVEISSRVYTTVDQENYEYLFPGATVFKNKLGGTVITFAGSPVAEFNLVEAFSFLTYSRKQQMIELLNKIGELPVYYPGDEDVYLKVADMPNGDTFVALFNISLDTIESLKLVCNFKARAFEMLLPSGETKNVDFTCENDTYTLNIDAKTLDPVVVFVKK